MALGVASLTEIYDATPESAEQDQTARICTFVQSDLALHSPQISAWSGKAECEFNIKVIQCIWTRVLTWVSLRGSRRLTWVETSCCGAALAAALS